MTAKAGRGGMTQQEARATNSDGTKQQNRLGDEWTKRCAPDVLQCALLITKRASGQEDAMTGCGTRTRCSNDGSDDPALMTLQLQRHPPDIYAILDVRWRWTV
jgi:hypothetical protein